MARNFRMMLAVEPTSDLEGPLEPSTRGLELARPPQDRPRGTEGVGRARMVVPVRLGQQFDGILGRRLRLVVTASSDSATAR